MAIPPITSVGTALPPLPTTKPAATEGAGGLRRHGRQGPAERAGHAAPTPTRSRRPRTGNATDVHDYMIAATQANLATELTVAVRNKAVEAFNDIMRMQI